MVERRFVVGVGARIKNHRRTLVIISISSLFPTFAHSVYTATQCAMIRVFTSRISRISSIEHAATKTTLRRSFTRSPWTMVKKMPDRPPHLPEEEVTEAFLKGSGPGGQKINKTSSAVQLKHLPTGIVLKVQATRSRTQNRKIARDMLALRVEELEKGSKSRVAIVGEVKKRRKASAVKKSKKKYRLLEGAKGKREESGEAKEDDEGETGEGCGEKGR